MGLTNYTATIWISGVTASGKTTLGKHLYKDLLSSGIANLKYLDGEDLRNRQSRSYGYSVGERMEFWKEKEFNHCEKENVRKPLEY